jgi:hypothetical protein
MQRTYPSPGKTQCRYCGEQVLINSLSTHILKSHRLSVRSSMKPTLVKKSAASTDR